MKKLVSLMMVMVILLSFGAGAFADAVSSKNNGIKRGDMVVTYEEEIYVDDGEGNQVKVTIIENIYSEYNDVSINNKNGGVSVMGMYAEYPVGTRRSYTIKISNEVMGLPSIVSGGISFAAKKKAAQVAAEAIATKLGSKFIPGLNVVSYILGAAAWANAVTGKAGIEITVDLIYSETYFYRDGYYVYGWDIENIDIGRY